MRVESIFLVTEGAHLGSVAERPTRDEADE